MTDSTTDAKTTFILFAVIFLVIVIVAFGYVDDKRDERFQKQFDRIEAKCK